MSRIYYWQFFCNGMSTGNFFLSRNYYRHLFLSWSKYRHFLPQKKCITVALFCNHLTHTPCSLQTGSPAGLNITTLTASQMTTVTASRTAWNCGVCTTFRPATRDSHTPSCGTTGTARPRTCSCVKDFEREVSEGKQMF